MKHFRELISSSETVSKTIINILYERPEIPGFTMVSQELLSPILFLMNRARSEKKFNKVVNKIPFFKQQ